MLRNRKLEPHIWKLQNWRFISYNWLNIGTNHNDTLVKRENELCKSLIEDKSADHYFTFGTPNT